MLGIPAFPPYSHSVSESQLDFKFLAAEVPRPHTLTNWPVVHFLRASENQGHLHASPFLRGPTNGATCEALRSNPQRLCCGSSMENHFSAAIKPSRIIHLNKILQFLCGPLSPSRWQLFSALAACDGFAAVRACEPEEENFSST